MSAIVFLFGLAIGSFLNVCIVRLPKGKSVVRPASHCPGCQTPIKPYDNIPVLSYVLLRGRCRNCRASISLLYPAVEFLTGLLFVLCYWRFGLTAEGLKWAAFAALLVVLIITDLRERILPDATTLTGFGIGLLLSVVTAPADGTARWLAERWFAFPPPDPALSFVDALLGAAAGSGILWVVGEGYFRLRGREGMGLGDVKMMAMVGAFLGVRGTVLTILAGSVLGSVIGLVVIVAWRKGSAYELPFGTFLGAAALAVVFFGAPVLNWYQSLWAAR